ncbi:MAG: hypothetical protein HOO97_00840, partial [Sideroxydans sp.]|nr:hypothetical protein [Sideroxydans sp.]
MKAAPLLRAWLHRLRENGVRFHMRHRWVGWDEAGALRFEVRNNPHPSPDGRGAISSPSNNNNETEKPFSPREKGGDEGALVKIAHFDAVILALGGGSWPQLGSDGAWIALLEQHGAHVAPLRPSNCGFEIAWSDHFRERFVGEPLKSVAASFGEVRKQGECLITTHGIEGGLIYALSAPLRDEIERIGSATLHLDLLPDWSAEKVLAEVSHPRGSRSLSSHLQSRLGLKG